MSRCYFVEKDFATTVTKLRQQEYGNAKGFALDLSTLQWKDSDSESHILVAEDKGEIVSTMRGEIIAEKSLLEAKLECPWDFPLELEYPVLLLSRAATAASHRSEGLNLVLRYWFLKMAVHYGIRYVVGTFVAGSPREQTLRHMGYQFFENPRGWQQSSYKSLAPVQVVALDLAQSEQVFSYCEEVLGSRLDQFSLADSFPALKTVTQL